MRNEYNGGEWTPAKYQSFVKSALRSASKRWPPKFKCLKAASVGKRINAKTGRLAEHYRCACCTGLFPAKEVQVDHINPIIDPRIGFTNWDDVVHAMYCEQSNLQVLCLTCHKEKTAQERAIAKEFKSAK